MPEITGVVTAKSAYGIMLDELGERWCNWSREDMRGEPFDTTVQKGDVVCITYQETEKKDGTPATYISVIDKVTQSRDVTPADTPYEFPPPEGEPLPDGPHETRSAPAYSPVSGKDALMAKMNALKCAGELYAACINAGVYKKLPTPDEISAYAEAIEARLD